MITPAIRWQTWEGEGREHLAFAATADGFVAESVILSDREAVFGAHYRVVLDEHWRVRRAEITVVGGSRIVLTADGAGHWFDHDGTPLDALDGAIDLDLSASPFTNTLPIRRLGLPVGGSAEIVTAYVAFPELAVSPDPQRYTRLSAARWRYESLDSDFIREIDTDAEGFVTLYPGLFRRIA